MATIFLFFIFYFFQLLYQHAFETIFLDILFHFSSVVVLSEPIFEWEVAYSVIKGLGLIDVLYTSVWLTEK